MKIKRRGGFLENSSKNEVNSARSESFKGAGGGLNENFLKIDFLVVSNRGE